MRKRELKREMSSADAEMQAATAEQKKRKAADGTSQPGSGSGGGGAPPQSFNMRAVKAALPEMVGSGEWAQTTEMAMIQGMVGLAQEVQVLKGMLVRSYEGPADWIYVTKAKNAMKVYAKHCRDARGKGVQVGDCKNYVMIGMYLAYLEDPRVTAEQKQEADRLILAKVAGADGKATFEKAKNLAEMTGYAKVAAGTKKSYVNLEGRGKDGEMWAQMLEEALLQEGTRQWDEGAPEPVFKELKTALREMRAKNMGS